MRTNYHTKQKELIQKIIEEEKEEFTVKDLYEKLQKKIGLTTIYRYLENLEQEKQIHKTINSNNITTYQFLRKCNEINHFYLKCNSCGKLIHIDCNCIKELYSHIIKHHQFVLEKDNIVMNGICKSCNRKRKEEIKC